MITNLRMELFEALRRHCPHCHPHSAGARQVPADRGRGRGQPQAVGHLRGPPQGQEIRLREVGEVKRTLGMQICQYICRCDVILLCYDITRLETLQHCRTFWHQQILKFCPDTPIILVGCKNDLRWLKVSAIASLTILNDYDCQGTCIWMKST